MFLILSHIFYFLGIFPNYLGKSTKEHTKMEHYPVYLSLRDKRVLVVGTGECALAKLRLLMKTPARIEVYGFDPIDDLITLSAAGHIHLMRRDLCANDLTGA